MAGEDEILKPFGPSILKSKVDEDIFSILKVGVENSVKGFSSPPEVLAGTYLNGSNKNLLLNADDKTVFDQWVKNKAKNYFEQIKIRNLGHLANDLSLAHVWVNYQKSGDFNPIHTHSGILSFVIYMKVPKFINEQKQAGEITFRYGSDHDLAPCSLSILPEEGDFLMFPAWLDHYVWPFTISKETRISIAGNLFFS